MPDSTIPEIYCEQHHPSLVVSDVAAAADFYATKLAFNLDFTFGDPPTMAGVSVDRSQMFLEQGTPCPLGCSVYFVIGNADELHAFHKANGVDVVQPPEDKEYGLRDYVIRDLCGYHLSFGHRIYNDEPPIEVERVDVPVRLEKRLAALLRDLAEHKHMSLSSLLEEILLHTNEPLGDGVASPHNRGDLRYIQKLKQKHGIDYDSHGSYRFVERPR